jgi:hypothetical protein
MVIDLIRNAMEVFTRHEKMHTGTLVEYTPREGEQSYPAVVMQEWPDGSLQLYALHFENSHQVRSAHPSQVKPILDPRHIVALMVQYDQHDQRLAVLEKQVDTLLAHIRDLTSAKETAKPARVESTRELPNASPAAASPALEENPDALPQTGTVVPEGADQAVEEKKPRKASWASKSTT